MKVKVIRVIVYEGDEAAVRKAIQLSRPLGKTDCGKGDGGHWTMTIGEHLNELPPLPETVLTAEEVRNATKTVSKKRDHTHNCQFELSNGGVCFCGADD